jgi:menaquinone-dependent protoporphyrinogen oxidase
MPDKILVTYASLTGSTGEVAEAIGKTLVESGLQVDVRPMKEIHDLSPYRAVVAGSAIHGAKWLPEAMQFMHTYQAELSRRPFAAFLVCITLGMPGAAKYRDGVSSWMEPVRALVRPVSEGLFAGNMDLARLPLTFDAVMVRVAVALKALPNGDHRDWVAVRAWAATLPGLLV